MKPKERFYGYALMSTNCDRDANNIKDDIPIDLSTKRQSPIVHSISPFPSSDFEAHSIDSSLSFNEWSSKYLLSNTTARNLQIQTNPNLLPYLLLNRTCFDVASPVADSDLKTSKNEIIYDQYGNSYRMGADHSLIPLRSSPYIELCKTNAFKRVAQNGSHISSSNNSSSNSSSPSTHNSHQDYNETKRLLEKSPTSSSTLSETPDTIKMNRSQYRSNNKRKVSHNLIRSYSFPSITKALKMNDLETNLSKSKSESNLKLFGFKKFEEKQKEKVAFKPKSLAISRYSNGQDFERIKATNRKYNNQQQTTLINQYYKRNESENNDSDNEKEDEDDIIESGVSDDYGSDDALDLRVTNSLEKFGPDLSHTDPENIFHHINSFLNQNSPPAKDELSSPTANPLDLYRQYYYYLMHQPAFASRAVAAVAVAETYAKLISSVHHNNRNLHHHNSVDKCDANTSIYENENQSPDYLLNGSRAELRSADTTNNSISFDRKRISRPLTGKHVRHGTGASPSTLISLRNMIQQRQRLKEIGALDANKYGKGKGGKRVKRK
jgi:hypothetical protein